MAINILGGRFKGISLQVPKGDMIRPTSVLLKRRLFDAHQNFSGEIFFDLCAGSGSVGLEALSREADKVFFIEPNKAVYKILCSNIKACEKHAKKSLSSQVSTFNSKLENWFSGLKAAYLSLEPEQQENTIFFLDPPYHMIELYEKFMFEFLDRDWFSGEVWLECDKQKGVKSEHWLEEKFEKIKLYKQGTSYVLKLKLC